MWAGLALALLDPSEVDSNMEQLMQCLLHIINSLFAASQIGILLYSPENDFGPSLFDTNLKKL